jgi:hypothetical protein
VANGVCFYSKWSVDGPGPADMQTASISVALYDNKVLCPMELGSRLCVYVLDV